MGFHKRYINSSLTKKFLFEDRLKLLYKADALIFEDKISSQIHDLYNEGKTNNEIKSFYEKNSINL